MDKAFLKENNLLDERNRMMQLFEMITVGGNAYEEDEDPNMAPADPNMGGDPNAMGGDPNMAPADPNAAPEGDNVETGLAPQVDAETAPPVDTPADAPVDAPEEDVEEIDVDDLTDSQESTEHKVDQLSHTLKGILSQFSDIAKHIDDNNAHIEALQQELKAEIEKRNPTPEEQAAKQVNVSTPFSVKPEDFQPAIDQEVSATPEPQYQIHQSDVDGYNNWREIAKSLSGDSYRQSLKDIFGY